MWAHLWVSTPVVFFHRYLFCHFDHWHLTHRRVDFHQLSGLPPWFNHNQRITHNNYSFIKSSIALILYLDCCLTSSMTKEPWKYKFWWLNWSSFTQAISTETASPGWAISNKGKYLKSTSWAKFGIFPSQWKRPACIFQVFTLVWNLPALCCFFSSNSLCKRALVRAKLC